MSNNWEDGLRNAPAVVREVELSRQERQAEIERAEAEANEMLSLMLIPGIKRLYEMLQSDDPQTVLRAIDLIMSRKIPKVAAKHVEEKGDVIDSADVASLRESIVAEIKRKTGT